MIEKESRLSGVVKSLGLVFRDMEVISVERLMKHAGIEEKTIFYGLEDITTQNVFWKIFSLIKRISPTFIQFHKLPAHQLHCDVTRVDLLSD